MVAKSSQLYKEMGERKDTLWQNTLVRPLKGLRKCKMLEVLLMVIGFIGVKEWVIILNSLRKYKLFLGDRMVNALSVILTLPLRINWNATILSQSPKGERTFSIICSYYTYIATMSKQQWIIATEDVPMTMVVLLRSRVSGKLSCSVLKTSRCGYMTA